MNGKQLKNSILQWAIQGKLVPQDPNDEPASVLLDKIRQEKERLIKEKKIKRDKNASIIYRGEDNSYYEKMFATGELKCIDEEVPFEIPKGWEWCRLNDLALYRKGPFGSSLTKSMFVAKSNQSVKVYEQKNAIQKDFRLGDYYISKEKFEAMQSFIVKPNDIIVSCAGTIGETYLLPLDAPVGIINQALMRVTLFDLSMAEYWQMYFAYMLLNEAQMKGAGSAIKNIPPFEYLKAVLVPVPPLSEQSRLVERYNLLLSLIAKYESEADKLNCLNLNIYDKLKKTVLQEAIQGKLVQQIAEEGTAHELLEQIKAEKQKLVKEGKLKKSALASSVIFRGDDNKYYEQIGENCNDITDEIPFDLPYNWCWCRFSNIVSMTIGKTPARGEQTYWINGKYNWVSISDMVDGGSISTTKEKVSDLAVKEVFSAPISEKGSLLMSFKLSIGKTSILDIDAYHNEAIITISPIIDKEYAMRNYLFKVLPLIANLGESKDAIKGKTLNSKSLSNLLIPLPPLQEQQRIIEQMNRLSKQLR